MTSQGIRVLKFGGSSVADPAVMRRAAMVTTAALSRDGRPGSGPGVVVVSALGGVTRELLRIADDAITSGAAAASGRVTELRTRHTDFLAQLDLGEPETPTMEQSIHDRFVALERLLEERPETPTAGERAAFEDSILAYGELLASELFWSVLTSLGVRCVWMDARDFLRTDARFRTAAPKLDTTRRLARSTLVPLLEREQSVVVPGFVGATSDGTPTTMGFEASDLTATVVASALDAQEVQIWTDVSGVMSADPQIVPTATPIPHLDYDSARELAFLGARVLHPDTMRPARSASIAIRVVNCSRPGEAGTVIDEQGPDPADTSARVVASRSGQRVITVEVGEELAGPVLAFLRNLASRQLIDDALFAKRSIQNGVEVVVVAAPSTALEGLADAAARFGTVASSDGWSVVSIVACHGGGPKWPSVSEPVLEWEGLGRSLGALVPDDRCEATVRGIHEQSLAQRSTAEGVRR